MKMPLPSVHGRWQRAKSLRILLLHIHLARGGEPGWDSGLYPVQRFSPLDVHNYHHVSLNWSAHAKLTPGHGIHCLLPPWCLGRWGLGWNVTLGMGMSHWERDIKGGTVQDGLCWKEGRGKTLLLEAHEVVGNKAVGNHTGKTIHFSIFEL